VGGIGLLVNLAITYAGVNIFGLWYLTAFLVGLLISWTCSFVLNALLTFPEHERSAYLKKYLLFLANYGVVIAINMTLVYALTSQLAVHYLISIITSALVTTPLSFSFSKRFIYVA